VSTDFAHLVPVLGIGLITGLLAGAFGVGGGIFCTPVLRMFFDVAPHVAVGTTMTMIIPTAFVGAYNYIRTGMVEFRLVRWLLIPCVLVTVVGAQATNYVHGQILMLLFAALAATSGIDLTLGISKKLSKHAAPDALPQDKTVQVDVQAEFPHYRRTSLILGCVTGFMAGFFGVGGGFILVPAMLYFFRISTKRAFGTSLLIVASISMPGTITHALGGHVDFPLALMLIAGAVPGSWLGSLIALRMRDKNLRKGFGIIMIVMSIVLAARELQNFQAN
jgi:uncharacterized membrane protein YfcA